MKKFGFSLKYKKGGVAREISNNIENRLFSSEYKYILEKGFAEAPPRAN